MTEVSQRFPPAFGFLRTYREDAWWVGPMLTAVGLLAFVVYSTWAAFQGAHYEWGPYLSPFYSPLIEVSWFPFSPALLILWAPAGFRLTCYYYRKAYYRALFFTPIGCAVGAKPQNYKGERFLLLFQNLHRYFMYLAMVFIFILSYDAIKAFWFEGRIGMGVGSVVLTLNALFLAFFTFGCNSLRHVVGGNVDCFSCVRFGTTRHGLWRVVSKFNRWHMQWAWVSLFWVGFTDAYIRLVSLGLLTDIRIF